MLTCVLVNNCHLSTVINNTHAGITEIAIPNGTSRPAKRHFLVQETAHRRGRKIIPRKHKNIYEKACIIEIFFVPL